MAFNRARKFIAWDVARTPGYVERSIPRRPGHALGRALNKERESFILARGSALLGQYIVMIPPYCCEVIGPELFLCLATIKRQFSLPPFRLCSRLGAIFPRHGHRNGFLPRETAIELEPGLLVSILEIESHFLDEIGSPCSNLTLLLNELPKRAGRNTSGRFTSLLERRGLNLLNLANALPVACKASGNRIAASFLFSRNSARLSGHGNQARAKYLLCQGIFFLFTNVNILCYDASKIVEERSPTNGTSAFLYLMPHMRMAQSLL